VEYRGGVARIQKGEAYIGTCHIFH
jgi:hypothetical protein